MSPKDNPSSIKTGKMILQGTCHSPFAEDVWTKYPEQMIVFYTGDMQLCRRALHKYINPWLVV